MTGLIPAENWEYGLVDIMRGVVATLGLDRKQDVIHIKGVGECVPARSARAAIYAAIKALNLPPGARIGVPLYCCPVVFRAIEAAACTHTFIDVDPTNCCMSAEDLFAKRNNVDAIVAVHMFGNACDINVLQAAAQDKPIIEDCAQSIGSKINGQMTGSVGTISVFSFRSGKYLSAGEGGAIFSNQEEIRTKLSKIISKMPAPKLTDEIVHMAATYIRTKLRSKPLYGLIGHPLWAFYNKAVDYSNKSPIKLSQNYKTDMAITVKRLAQLDSAIEKQRENADYFSRILQLDTQLLCREKTDSAYNRYLYPILFSSALQRDQVAAHLLKNKIGTAKPYHDIASVAARHYGYKGDCAASERIADGVLVIPSHYRLTKKEVERIARGVNSAWKEVMRASD